MSMELSRRALDAVQSRCIERSKSLSLWSMPADRRAVALSYGVWDG